MKWLKGEELYSKNAGNEIWKTAEMWWMDLSETQRERFIKRDGIDWNNMRIYQRSNLIIEWWKEAEGIVW